MCDNTAVSWSEQNAFLINAQVGTKQALSEKLLAYMDIYEKQGYSESFLQGMERARSIILSTTATSVPSNQEPLF